MSSTASIEELIKEYSDKFDYNKKETAIILAAGHGKRIKSQTSKMLHKIWEKPTVERVYNACVKGLQQSNIIIVVGIKAEDVIKTIGKRESLIYAYQEMQNGTGHAVQTALKNIDISKYDGTVYVFPGDMGLIDAETIQFLKDEFLKSNSDMIVLTGIYEGDIQNNYYGRIIRVKDRDSKGNKVLKFKGKVIEILEYKDILNLDDKKKYKIKYRGKEFSYTKKELLENREFNSGVYAFKFKPLSELINKLESNNVQNEIYLTDLIGLFNKHNYSVAAISPKQQYVLMGFNNKSVLKEMDDIARKVAYEKLKDIILIDDPDDFFIDDDVIEDILRMDKLGVPLDIKIGKGVYIGKGAKLNYNLNLMKNVFISGNIIFGKNIIVRENAHLSCFPNQTLQIGNNVEIFWGDVIKGNVTIGDNCSIESGVRITGSDEFPVKIYNDVTIKGVTYIFGSIIYENIFIEHSVLIKKIIQKPLDFSGDKFKVRFYLPEPEGKEAIKDLNQN
ncbi:MAG: NTP transferase domain-containing protein [Melioribacter sp.]|uniref:NTP transferase domain-containing protein n=1 Tax=Rosettibacter primus TaxID=3111523 RepID=UPI00247B464A|nr:NTP transferase domain-containing protein [Melioribacter sp.]